MKIAICGKGGSGKSTVTAVLAREFGRRGRKVIVIDSDESNSGLHWMLGMEQAPQPLMEFVGGKKKIQNEMTAGFTREGEAYEVSLWRQETLTIDDIPAGHVAGDNGLLMLATGKIDRTFEGCACPMGVVTREFMKKLETGDKQVVIVDMEAGVEHFGRGIESSLDGVLVVVEPSLESLNLAHKTKLLTLEGGASFMGAVLNKVRSEDSLNLLIKELDKREINSLGVLGHHSRLLDDGLMGRPVDLGHQAGEASVIADNITKVVVA